MRNDGKYAFGSLKDRTRILELPYKGNNLSMVIIMPSQFDGLPALEKKLTAKMLNESLKKLRKGGFRVYVPKFRLDTKYSLNAPLEAMGMSDAFDESKADFTGITGPPANELFIKSVSHRAYLDVNEEGSVATAVTVVITGLPSGSPSIVIDHPFLFLIRDRQTGGILFLGRVMDPRG